MTGTGRVAGWMSDGVRALLPMTLHVKSSRLHPTGAGAGVGSSLYSRTWWDLCAWFRFPLLLWRVWQSVH